MVRQAQAGQGGTSPLPGLCNARPRGSSHMGAPPFPAPGPLQPDAGRPVRLHDVCRSARKRPRPCCACTPSTVALVGHSSPAAFVQVAFDEDYSFLCNAFSLKKTTMASVAWVFYMSKVRAHDRPLPLVRPSPSAPLNLPLPHIPRFLRFLTSSTRSSSLRAASGAS